jgi:DnaJ-class molecular chaperone
MMGFFDKLKFIAKSYYNSYFSNNEEDEKPEFSAPQFEFSRDSNTIRYVPEEVIRARKKLGLNGTETWKEIHKKFFSLMKKNHPDKYQDPKEKEKATEITKSLTEAYAILEKYENR